MATTRTVLQRKLTAEPGDLYMSFELGDKHWQISIGNDRHGLSRYTVGAGHTDEVAGCIVKAAARFRIGGNARVHSCYEAGRDGWWLHRWLTTLGVDNIVVDPYTLAGVMTNQHREQLVGIQPVRLRSPCTPVDFDAGWLCSTSSEVMRFVCAMRSCASRWSSR